VKTPSLLSKAIARHSSIETEELWTLILVICWAYSPLFFLSGHFFRLSFKYIEFLSFVHMKLQSTVSIQWSRVYRHQLPLAHFRAIVVSRLLTYASPAWRGFITTDDIQRVAAFILRYKRRHYLHAFLPPKILNQKCRNCSGSVYTYDRLLPQHQGTWLIKTS